MAIFYFDPESTSSLALLNYLTFHTNTYPTFGFVVRYKPNRTGEGRRTGLSGYGVELALKNTDYLVVDDRDSGSSVVNRTKGEVGTTEHGFFAEVLGSDPWAELSIPLTKKELSGELQLTRKNVWLMVLDIGLKAASLILDSEDPLTALQELSQDFPRYSAALARNVEVSTRVQSKVPDLFAMGPAEPAIYINGKAHRGPDLNAFS